MGANFNPAVGSIALERVNHASGPGIMADQGVRTFVLRWIYGGGDDGTDD